MKRIAIILLMFLYLIPAIGVTVAAHYCGGKIASVSINSFDTKHKCPCGSKKMAKDCCKNKTTTIKFDDEQQKTQQVLCNSMKVTDFQPALLNNLNFDYHSPLLSTEFDHSTHRPDDLKHPLYIRQCVFRI
ncbi:MAG: hypothetical protein H0V01_07615 [Bacteroidetes bacterium]|nr:hypothetical protein [Bacteroidota bacterium]HET6243110.1 hypothetical protein [Bacteroidia bacterium]